jgi:hypothetical protein
MPKRTSAGPGLESGADTPISLRQRIHYNAAMRPTRELAVGMILVALLTLAFVIVRYGRILPWAAR